MLVFAGCQQRGFVNQICQIRSRKSRRTAGNDGKIDILGQRNFFHVNFQYLFASFFIRIGNRYLTVKTPRTQQSRIQNVGTVGRRNQNNVFICLKAVHFYQQLVQGLFSLIMTAA